MKKVVKTALVVIGVVATVEDVYVKAATIGHYLTNDGYGYQKNLMGYSEWLHDGLLRYKEELKAILKG